MSVCDSPATPPATTITAPNSPSARATVSTTPYATPTRIAGSVIRQKVWNFEAPSVVAASSCSVPISRSTGSTSRTTNGSVTNTVASTIPGSEKITGNAPPSQPSLPQNRTSATPTITGETAKGRSTMASSSPRPRKFPRASASAVTRPNTTLSGTVIATIVSDSVIAAIAAGVVIDS